MGTQTSATHKAFLVISTNWLAILAAGMVIYIASGKVSDLMLNKPNEADIANYLSQAATPSCRVSVSDVKNLQCGTDRILSNSYGYVYTCVFSVPRRNYSGAVRADNVGKWHFEPIPGAGYGNINSHCQ